jgi:YHS domain-containing protein
MHLPDGVTGCRSASHQPIGAAERGRPASDWVDIETKCPQLADSHRAGIMIRGAGASVRWWTSSRVMLREWNMNDAGCAGCERSRTPWTRLATGAVVGVLSVVLGMSVVVSPAQAFSTEKEKESEADAGQSVGVSEPDAMLEGYCPVAYLLKNKAMKGDPKFAVEYRGLIYYCANEEHKQRFVADPEKYLPQFGGLATLALGGSYGNRFLGDPTVFEVYEGKVYLFVQSRSLRYFDDHREMVIRQATERWAKPALGGNCPVAYQAAGKAVKGDPKYTAQAGVWQYQFTSEEARKRFEQDRDRFLPAYNGYCAVAVSHGKPFPGDAEVFRVVDERTFLLYDPDAAKVFDAAPAAVIKAAEKHWAQKLGPDEEKNLRGPRAPKG